MDDPDRLSRILGAGGPHPQPDDTSGLWLLPAIIAGAGIWAAPTAAEAARVLLADEVALFKLAWAYDGEDAAQMGEPNPHDLAYCEDDPDWTESRLACARAALRALAGEGKP